MRTPRRQVRPCRALLSAPIAGQAVVAPLVTAAAPAQADATLCEPFETTTIQERYVVQNNRWGSDVTQCATGTGFRVTRADSSAPTGGAPKSYPSVSSGCHYTTCSPGTSLPARLNTASRAPSGISYSFVDNAAYDIWLDPAPRTDGVKRTEIMIWFNQVGPIQPIGSPVGSATVGGRSWEVWSGGTSSNDVLSFVVPSAISGWEFDVMDFVRAAAARGLAEDDWYLTSVQAGFADRGRTAPG